MNGQRLANSGERNATRFLLIAMSYLLIAVLLTGCSPQWRRKFIRKSKIINPPQPILVLQSEEQSLYPPDARYRAHYAYWKSWHSDLLDSLGQTRKRDLSELNGTLGELRSMLALLSGPPADHLRAIVMELVDMKATWDRTPEPWGPSALTRLRLEQLRREIDKSFHYSKVKKWIPTGKSSSPKP